MVSFGCRNRIRTDVIRRRAHAPSRSAATSGFTKGSCDASNRDAVADFYSGNC